MAISLSSHNNGRLLQAANAVPARGSAETGRVRRTSSPFGQMMSDSVSSSGGVRRSAAADQTELAVVRRSAAETAPEFRNYAPPPASRPAEPPLAAAVEKTPGRLASNFQPRFLEPDNARFNKLNYASADTAEALAAHFGGKVSAHQYKWMTGKATISGTLDVVQPPSFATIDFGHTQVNAGLLATIYEPGKFTNPDARAAEVLYRAGVRNEFVDQHLPAYMKAVPMEYAVNPVTGKEFKVPEFSFSQLA